MRNFTIIIIFFLVIVVSNCLAQGIGINENSATPDASAMLDVASTDKGILIPRMTESQRDAITTPATGLMVFQIDNNPGFYYYSGSVWTATGVGTISIDDLTDGISSDASSVFLGMDAGGNDSGTSNRNTGIGIRALYTNSTGYDNIGIGYNCLRLNTVGHHNIAIGTEALDNNSTGNYNTAVGYQSLKSNTSGQWNTALGAEALSSNTIGQYNTASGKGALTANSTGGHNSAFGVSALYSNSYGSGNTAMGSSALQTNTGGTNNSAFGYKSLTWNTLGHSNTALGHDCLYFNTAGTSNTAIGTWCMRSNILGNNNTAIGYSANFHNENGSNNTILGFEAGRGTSSHDKSGNVFLGYQAGYGETGSNKLYIENTSSFLPLIYGEFDSDLLRINGTLHIRNAYQFPNSDGIQGQVLTTNGSGLINWQTDVDEFSNGGEASGSDRSLGNKDYYDLSLFTNNIARIHIERDGDVGIGTISPTEKLHVAGSTYISDQLSLGGTQVNMKSFISHDRYHMGLTETGAGTDEKNWCIQADNDQLTFQGVTDDWGGWNTNFFLNRNGAAIDRGAFLVDNFGFRDAYPDAVVEISADNGNDDFLMISSDDNNDGDILVVKNNGQVGIGMIGPSYELDVNGDIRADDFLYSSDRRLKANILDLTGSLVKIQMLNGVAFNWKESGKSDIGLVAQEVEKIYPEIVRSDEKNGLKSVSYASLVAPLIEAIKEQQIMIDKLNSRVDLLETQLSISKNISN